MLREIEYFCGPEKSVVGQTRSVGLAM